jgi:Tol biopolymer transport system component
LAWTDLTGNLLTRVSETRGYASLALSPDESRIAAEVYDPDPHIWLLDSKSGLGGRLTNSPEPESYPHWAPDGKSIYYVALTASAFEIRRSFLDNASRPEVLWRSESLNAPAPRLSGISPDGCCLLVIRRGGSLYRLDLKSSQPGKMELLEKRGNAYYAWLSPDGRTLVSRAPGRGLELEAYPLTAGSIRRFSRVSEFFDQPFFGADGRSLYAQTQGNLVVFPLAPDRSIGEPRFLRPWLTTNKVGADGGVASRDGKRLLLIETDQEEILNPQVRTDWTTLLPK